MPKRNTIKIYDGQNDKKNSDSKSKGFLKSNDQNLSKNRKSKKSLGLFFDDDVKDEDVMSSQNYWYRGELMKLVPDALSELLKATKK